MSAGTLEATLKERVTALVGPDLALVEAEIHRHIHSSVALIGEMGAWIAGAGGKRLRPMLLLLVARLAGDGGPRTARLGAAVELLHTATLIHDDVVDRAHLRRGQASANARWGDDAAVLVGDYLYARSFALLVETGDTRMLDTLARATVSMTEAEVFQLERKRAGLVTEVDYLRIIGDKTAAFIAACCRIGALVGGAGPDAVEVLGSYGQDIGVAFQIADDALDFAADEARLGKAIGSDLREGKRTLPLIAALAAATPGEQARVDALLRAALTDGAGADAVEEIRKLVLRHDGVDYARGRARGYAAAAKARLAAFPPSDARELLELVADFVVDRDR